MRVVPQIVATCDEYRRASYVLRVLYAQVRPHLDTRRIARLPGQSPEELLIELVEPLRILPRLVEARALLDEGVNQKLFTLRRDEHGEVTALEVVAFPPSAEVAREKLRTAGAIRQQRHRDKIKRAAEEAARVAAEKTKNAEGDAGERNALDVRVTPPVTPSTPVTETSSFSVTSPLSTAVTSSQAPTGAPLPPPSLHSLQGMEEEGRGSARTHEAPANGAVTAAVTPTVTPSVEPVTPSVEPVTPPSPRAVDDLAVIGPEGARRFRTASELAALGAPSRGDLTIALLSEDGGKVFHKAARAEERKELGAVVNELGYGAEELWRVAVCWRSCDDVVKKMFPRSSVTSSGRINVGFLLAPDEDRGRHLRVAVAFAEKWFRERDKVQQENTKRHRLSNAAFTPARAGVDVPSPGKAVSK